MPRPARQRDVPSKSARRREELIERIIELFLEEGFADLSLDDIARELHCSKSTLYAIAKSKEQIIVAVVRAFFRRAALRVESRLRRDDPASVDRIGTYLQAISAELAPASATFFADLDSFPATREIYRDNTRIAAHRVQAIVLDTIPDASRVEATFVGTVAGQIMEAIHRGEIESATGLDDSAAYRALSSLITDGILAFAPGSDRRRDGMLALVTPLGRTPHEPEED